jgi:archaemetzincin
MPDDVLAFEPDTEPQPTHEYVNADYRNRVTPERNVIYLYDAPTVAPEVAHVETWTDPVVPSGAENAPPSGSQTASRPNVMSIAEYAKAFYHGIEVRYIYHRFRLVAWKDARRGKKKVDCIGLEAPATLEHTASVTQIRHRPSRDGVAPGGQLNLNDLLDGLQEALPSDAYAAMLLMHHDMYEDDDDDFCCGRAYGASRISVMSTFRDHPKLGPSQGIMLDHTWPNSHCREYVDDVWACSLEQENKTSLSKTQSFNRSQMLRLVDTAKAKRSGSGGDGASSGSQLPEPIFAAVQSTSSLAAADFKRRHWEQTWLERACVIAVHELGHCFGLDHCVYYACVMQGTASVAEDSQQPPYLCPVCQAKVAYTVAVESASTKGRRKRTEKEVERLVKKWTLDQYGALMAHCEKHRDGFMFRAMEAWLQGRIGEITESNSLPERPEISGGKTSGRKRTASYFTDLLD